MLLDYIKKFLKTRFSPFRFFSFITISLFLFLSVQNAFSIDVRLTWNGDTESEIAGYKVFLHEKGQDYDFSDPSWQGTTTTCTITDLDPNTTYYFVARAFDISNNESPNSNEVIFSNGVTLESIDLGANNASGCFIATVDNDSK